MIQIGCKVTTFFLIMQIFLRKKSTFHQKRLHISFFVVTLHPKTILTRTEQRTTQVATLLDMLPNKFTTADAVLIGKEILPAGSIVRHKRLTSYS